MAIAPVQVLALRPLLWVILARRSFWYCLPTVRPCLRSVTTSSRLGANLKVRLEHFMPLGWSITPAKLIGRWRCVGRWRLIGRGLWLLWLRL